MNQSGVVDLSGLKDSHRQESDFDALEPDEQQALDDMAAADDTPTGDRVLTAFLVFQQPDGQWIATHEISKVADIRPDRSAILDDFVAAAANITKDVTAATTSQQVVTVMMQQAQQVQRLAHDQALANRLGVGKNK
jgi:hypothetical protein